jgi:hypothetical protein
VILGDNARALVLGRDHATGTVVFQRAYLAFRRDWDVQPRACAPYRARTKGKTEAGVKSVKHNGLAEREFDAFAALERHLAAWMVTADERKHGTTHEAPLVRLTGTSAPPCGRFRPAHSHGGSSAVNSLENRTERFERAQHPQSGKHLTQAVNPRGSRGLHAPLPVRRAYTDSGVLDGDQGTRGRRGAGPGGAVCPATKTDV